MVRVLSGLVVWVEGGNGGRYSGREHSGPACRESRECDVTCIMLL